MVRFTLVCCFGSKFDTGFVIIVTFAHGQKSRTVSGYKCCGRRDILSSADTLTLVENGEIFMLQGA